MGLTPKIGSDEPVYRRVPIPTRVIDIYQPLMEHGRAEMIGRVARQGQATFELLERFDRHYRQLRQSHRVLLFSDLPHKLARELPDRGDDLLTEMYYRLDSRVGHLLLDEFQDTSVEQWEVFKPFAQEIASFADGTRTFFCVGDGKQAIYGWRGGCAEIFDRLEEDLNLSLKSRKSLSKSYRSSPAILEAANRVFGSLAENPALVDKLPAVIAEWTTRFETHTTHHADRPGYVELITSPVTEEEPESGEPGEEGTIGGPSVHERYSAARIAELARAMPGRGIGVLVGTNNMVRRMIFLLQDLGIEASGEGGNPVTDDPAVGVVLSALTLADHPGDSAAAFHLFNSPLAGVVGLDAMTAEAIGHAGLVIRRSLLAGGYAPLLAQWARKLADSCTARSLGRLMQLIELAERFDPTATLRTRDFVAYVEATSVEQPAGAAVRIMTVHKAKGLEFDVVVLPELDRTLLSVGDLPVYVSRATPTGPIEAIYRATNEAVRKLCPEIAEAHEQEKARRLRDDLCALYVAMTRPKYALHMIIKPLKQLKDGSPGSRGWSNLSFASMLRRGLVPGGATFDGEAILFDFGDRAWFKKLPKGDALAEAAKSAAPLRPKLLAAAGPSRRSWPVVTPSSLESSGVIHAADLLAMETSTNRLRGTVLHALFEQVGFLDRDRMPDEADLLAAARGAAPLAEEKWLRQTLAEFRQMLAKPSVIAALSLPTAGEAELWRERSFVVRIGQEMMQGQFDRVVIERKEGRVVRADLLDFKSDAVTPENRAGRVEGYRPQVEAYRKALVGILGVAPAAVNARLLFVATGECVAV
jgi:ATP-dependent helicase/nuclease subunit A